MIDIKEYMSILIYGFNGNVIGDDIGKIGGFIGVNVLIGYIFKYV